MDIVPLSDAVTPYAFTQQSRKNLLGNALWDLRLGSDRICTHHISGFHRPRLSVTGCYASVFVIAFFLLLSVIIAQCYPLVKRFLKKILEFLFSVLRLFIQAKQLDRGFLHLVFQNLAGGIHRKFLYKHEVTRHLVLCHVGIAVCAHFRLIGLLALL